MVVKAAPMVMRLKKLWRDQAGATAIEYGLIAAGIAVVVIGGVTLVGRSASRQYTDVAVQIDKAGEGSTSGTRGPVVKPPPRKISHPGPKTRRFKK